MATDKEATMTLLKRGSKGPQVALLADMLARCGFPTYWPNDVIIDEGPIVKFQLFRSLLPDGIVGSLTWGALERLVAGVTCTLDGAAQSHAEAWGRRLQSALGAWASGLVGYATPRDNRAKLMQRPLENRHCADSLRPAELAKAKANGYTTTHTLGGCGSFAERLLACVVGDAEHRAAWNQTAIAPPRELRDVRFYNINDNTVGAMINGDKKWVHTTAKGKKSYPNCRGYSALFDSPLQDIEWDEVEKMTAPYAILHLDGGHVLTAFRVDESKGWRYNHPTNGCALVDGVWIIGADGSKKAVGQPTTLQMAKYRKGKKRIAFLWPLIAPGGYNGAVDVGAVLDGGAK
jgi:hypothetical protein